MPAGFPWEATFSINDFFVQSIGGEVGVNESWGYALNYRPVEVGGCQQQVGAGDEVLFGFFSEVPRTTQSGRC